MLKQLYLTNRFFLLFGLVVVGMIIGFVIPIAFPVAQTALVLGLAVVVLDILLLFNKSVRVRCRRRTAMARRRH